MDFRGDPTSALLEVLDPEQNYAFQDHYLEAPFDLSDVMFITTANLLDTDPARAARPHGGHPLPRLHRGREAAHRAAVPHPQAAQGARAQRRASSRSPRPRVREIIRRYTREAGVRNLERDDRGDLPPGRAQGRRGQEGQDDRHARGTLHKYLGPPKFSYGMAEEKDEVGVATGLVWTEVGGDVIFIEATTMTGKGDAHPHRPARRRHARVGAGRGLLHPHARQGARHRRGLPREATTCTSTCRPPRSPRTGPRRASRWRRRSPPRSSGAPCAATSR